MIQLQILKWGNYPGLSKVAVSVLRSGRGSRSVGVREGMTMEEEAEVMSSLALRIGGREQKTRKAGSV